jgi:chaperonin GroES
MIQPIKNQIVLKCFQVAEKSAGGIIVPENARPLGNKGEIVAVGKGTPKRPMKLKVGQIAYRVKDWGQIFEENGQKYFIMEDSAILATD